MHGHHHHDARPTRDDIARAVGHFRDAVGADRSRAAFGPFGGPFGGHFGDLFGGPMGPRGGRGRGPGGRARRGDVRAAVIALLAERPMHGYEIIQELAERTGGIWKPSPGSVYPTLQLLEDEGHVAAEEDGGKRRFSLTESGRELAAEIAERKAPWQEVTDGVEPGIFALRHSFGLLFEATAQIGRAGTPEQQVEAEAILAETRRRLYAILAAEA